MALARCHLVVQDEEGNVVDGASVEVRSEVAGSPLVPIYSDRDGANSLENPFTAADGADAGFHVAGGAYKVTATLGAFTRTWRYVAVGTAQEQDFQTSLNPRGAWDDVTTYAKADYVERHGANFVSNVNDNLNHEPVTSPVPASNAYWTLSGRPSRYDLSTYDTDRPASGEQICKWVAPEGGATFYAGLTDSRGSSDDAATSDAVFSIRKNGVEFGTITFSASASTAVFAAASDAQFDDGDVLTIIAPSPRDATLSGVSITLVGFVARP